jgi:hypothetical protein
MIKKVEQLKQLFREKPNLDTSSTEEESYLGKS